MLSVLLYSILSVQVVYSVQLNCAYSNYTEAAATCSAAQQHCTFTVQILYKLYSLQLNCTYSNYTEAAATYSVAQQHTNSPANVFWSAVHLAVLNYTCISTYTFSLVVRSDLSNSRYCHKTQCHLLTALRNTPKCSSLWNSVYINTHRQSHPEIRSFKFTLLAASAVSQFDSDKVQVDVTKITGKLCKLKKKFSMLRKWVWKFSATYPNYFSLLTVQLALHVK